MNRISLTRIFHEKFKITFTLIREIPLTQHRIRETAWLKAILCLSFISAGFYLNANTLKMRASWDFPDSEPIPVPARFFNAYRTHSGENAWFPGPGDFSSLSGGKQEIGGVNWNIAPADSPSVMMLEGPGSTVDTAQITGIPIGCDPGVIHFLHTFNPGPGLDKIESKNKIPAHPPQVFRYRFNYADGKSIVIHVDWRHHVAPWHEKRKPVDMFCSQPALEKVAGNGKLVLYRMSTVNPRPGKTLETLDMLPPEEKYRKEYGTPALFAISKSPLKTAGAAGTEWSLVDYCQSQGVPELRCDPKSGEFQVPFHCKSDRGAVLFRIEPVKGDFTFSARLKNMPLAANWAFAGITARPSILFKGRGGAEFGPYLYFKPAPKHPELKKRGIFYISDGKPLTGGIGFQDNKTSLKLPNQQDFKLPIRLKMQRKGDEFRSFHSCDGKTWTEFETITVKDCPEELYLGFYAALSHSPELIYAVFNDVSIEK